MTPREFVRELREEVETHSAVTHPFLRHFATGGLTRWQIWGYASQHYHLVCFFTAYLEAIAARTPDVKVRRLLGDILQDEYMRPQSFERSHAALYRRFMRAVGFEKGEWEGVPLLPATRAFVQLHLDMTLRSWLEALGAVGPGHEWAIPLMFPHLVQGLERSLPLDSAALEYFHLHINLDIEHGKALEESLLGWATTPENQEDVRRGARRSLDARAAFWSALGEQLFSDLASADAGSRTR